MSYKDPEKRKEWKRNNRDKVRAQQERYYKTEKGKAALKRAAERAKERWREYSVSPEVLEKKAAWEKQLAEWAATKKDRKRIASKRQRDARRARDIASGSKGCFPPKPQSYGKGCDWQIKSWNTKDFVRSAAW